MFEDVRSGDAAEIAVDEGDVDNRRIGEAAQVERVPVVYLDDFSTMTDDCGCTASREEQITEPTARARKGGVGARPRSVSSRTGPPLKKIARHGTRHASICRAPRDRIPGRLHLSAGPRDRCDQLARRTGLAARGRRAQSLWREPNRPRCPHATGARQRPSHHSAAPARCLRNLLDPAACSTAHHCARAADIAPVESPAKRIPSHLVGSQSLLALSRGHAASRRMPCVRSMCDQSESRRSSS